MSKFLSEQYVPTTHITRLKKARIANAIVSFIDSGFDERKFTSEVYKDGLMCMFGHIAHYDRQGFYVTWFSDDEKCLEWLVYVQNASIYGEPDYTLCDVEKDIQSYIFQNDLVYRYEQKVKAGVETRERAELARLRAKYEGVY